ncbi:DUF2809 domain-containing protein [Candidatus Gracilibacteria bacterium]|nr:DUF2809 domain-containing protein [Candidatus Gracilibacteria bacterium]
MYYSNNLGIWRGWIGDIVIISFLYFSIQSIIPIRRGICIVGIVLLAFSIESLQYLDLPKIMGWQDNEVIMILFGSVFDPLDLVSYTLGGLITWGLDHIFISKSLAKK